MGRSDGSNWDMSDKCYGQHSGQAGYVVEDRRLPIVVVHGVGSGSSQGRAGFSDNLLSGVSEPGRPAHKVGNFEPVKTPPTQTAPNGGIYWEEGIWELATDTTEEALKAALLPIVGQNILVKWIADEILDRVADVLGYLGLHGEEIRRIVRETINRHPYCVLIGHSLGSVIAADILREEQERDNFATMHVSGFITLGSPLNILGMRNSMTNRFPFRWYNLFYPTDPVALGRGLSSNRFPSVLNRKLNAHESFVVSHVSYWPSTVVSNIAYSLSARGARVTP